MAYIELYKQKLKENYSYLNNLFVAKNKEWAIVTKLLCGNKLYIKEIIDLGITEICDSRISNLKVVKELNPNIKTAYIKPPSRRSIASIIRYADTSFNTEYATIEMLNVEAAKRGKVHNVVIMIELGDLREGIMGENLLHFYERVLSLKNIKVTGIGANLNCLHGVLPSQDKLIQLSLYKQLIEAKFNHYIPLVSGGTSVIIPLLLKNEVPLGVNHFRVGETLFMGNNILNNKPIKGMSGDVFKLFAEIIEITQKPKIPIGELGKNPSGNEYEIDENDYGEKSYRAIINVGLLDISSPEYLIPEDSELTVIGASSDMVVLDLGNPPKYKVGDVISFKIKYMGALSLLNSDYIEKKLV